jgi:3-dehydroquinate synthase
VTGNDPNETTKPPMDTIRQHFAVNYEYPVIFTRDVFDLSNPALASVLEGQPDGVPHRAIVYIDDGFLAAWPDVPRRVTDYLANNADAVRLIRSPEPVPGGEHAKNGWNVVQNIMRSIGNERLCRHSFVIVIGGGSTLDMVGFAASIVHRGVRLIRIPTTVLAQGDAGVGVKNGMDEHGMKNYVGSFAPPVAVINDYDFLATLQGRYWFGGIAEAFKVAMIKDAAFFDQICDSATPLAGRQPGSIEPIVRRTAELHLDHIRTGGDPFEFGAARPLDFGHWAAHKLEVLSNYTLSHGEAVAIGIALDTRYATLSGLLCEAECKRVLDVFAAIGLPTCTSLLKRTTPDGELEILAGLEEFREHLGGQLTVTLPDGIGRGVEVHEMDPVRIRDSIDYLEKRNCDED